jgi:hypothetical protein
MTKGDHLQLLSEKKALERMLSATSEDQVITRSSLQSRLDGVLSSLSSAQVDEREPMDMQLTFKGKPVVGSEGILADFGTRAVACFNVLVEKLAASVEEPLADRGRVPNRGQHPLLITATARGSFGFVLREHATGQLRIDDDAPTPRAMRQAHRLLRGVLGSDEELADAAGESDPRALDQLRAFMQTMADADAYCTLTLDGEEVGFPSRDHVKYGLERIKRENLPEKETELEGRLLGVLPVHRTFEFELSKDKKIIHGKVPVAFADIDQLNDLLNRTIRIKVLETRVGKGSVRYRLLEVPSPEQA